MFLVFLIHLRIEEILVSIIIQQEAYLVNRIIFRTLTFRTLIFRIRVGYSNLLQLFSINRTFKLIINIRIVSLSLSRTTKVAILLILEESYSKYC